MRAALIFSISLLLSGCLGMPEQVSPVKPFDINKYMGNWYEIARLDHSFERGMTHVTAQYILNDDGSVKVVNKGYQKDKSKWKTAIGKAKFVEDPSTGYLKVSFFGPFYGSYVIFGLDEEDYEYAFVSGPDHSYLWLLARTPVVQPKVIELFKKEADSRGFDIDQLIWVDQNTIL